MTIPDFNEDGNIPIGEHEPTLSEFKTRFVEDFSPNARREELYNSYINYSMYLHTFSIAEKEWAGGSFTTTKNEPSDVDLLIYVDGIRLNEGNDKYDFWKNLDPEMIFYSFTCHTHLIISYPEGDPRNELHFEKRDYFEDLFQKDKKDRPRGILKFDLFSEEYISELKAEAGF